MIPTNYTICTCVQLPKFLAAWEREGDSLQQQQLSDDDDDGIRRRHRPLQYLLCHHHGRCSTVSGMGTYNGHIYVCVYPQGDTHPATLLATRLYPHTSYFITHCTDVLPLEFCEMPLFAVWV